MRTGARIILLAVLVALPGSAWAQRGQCAKDKGRMVPDLGYGTISCSHCHMSFDDNGPVSFEFNSEPRIGDITDVGEGRLREGDVLVAVDGQLITTAEGGRRLAAVRRGETVRLSVRREGRVHDVTVRAGERCMDHPRAPRPPRTPPSPRIPDPPAVPRAPRTPMPGQPHIPQPPQPPQPAQAPLPPLPPSPPDILPTGWFGFGISCDDCGWRRTRRGDTGAFFFSDAPEVVSVERGSPAERAGIRRGDRLTHVDGVALTTQEGARRFRAIRPGQAVTWTYRRGSRSYAARATAARRPDAPVAAAPGAPRAAGQRLRYSGVVGGSEVEVRGAPVNVTRDERTGELVIRSRDLTVRVKPTDEP
ncbi:MAG TPA: PDZ domain-containing protein [Longimicrobium sp.]|jgi:hypothetical protein